MAIIADAAVWYGGKNIQFEPITIADLAPHQVLVRVESADVNSTDAISLGPGAEIFAASDDKASWVGQLPQVLGHAISGTVEAVGSQVTRVAVGDRVLANNTPNCGTCWYCLNDEAYQCATQQLIGPEYAQTGEGMPVYAQSYVGGFAQYAVMAAVQVVPVHTDLSWQTLSLLACGYGSGLGAALVAGKVTRGSSVVALGLGSSGQAFIEAAKMVGAETIIGVDPIAERRERALEGGATHVIDPNDGDLAEQVRAAGSDRGGLEGRGADVVFESAADLGAMSGGLDLTRVGGQLVLSSLPWQVIGNVEYPAVQTAVWSRTVTGTQMGNLTPLRDFPRLVKLVERGLLRPERLLDGEYALADLKTAVADAGSHRVIGASLRPNA